MPEGSGMQAKKTRSGIWTPKAEKYDYDVDRPYVDESYWMDPVQ